MSGIRNVSVCRGHELANALYASTLLAQWPQKNGMLCYSNTAKKLDEYRAKIKRGRGGTYELPQRTVWDRDRLVGIAGRLQSNIADLYPSKYFPAVELSEPVNQEVAAMFQSAKNEPIYHATAVFH